MIPQVLCSLKDVGFPAEVPDAAAISTASKCRGHRCENLAYGVLNVKKRHTALEATIADTEWINRRTVWASWLGNNFLRNLFHAGGHIENTAYKQQLSPDQLLKKEGEDEASKEAWQKRCLVELRTSHTESLHRHLRRRLDVWSLCCQGIEYKGPLICWVASSNLSRPASGRLSFARFVMDGQLIAGCRGKALAFLGAGPAMTVSSTTPAVRCSVI